MLLQQREEYDAIVVGSGISGGWAAKELCEKGLRTIVLERGRDVEHKKDYITEHKPAWEFPLRERRILPDSPQAKDYQVQARTDPFREAGKHYFLKDTEHPYLEQQPFTWVQANVVGGRSLLWGRQCYRWSDLDFEANLRDGHGVDWPIRYRDIEPWYSYVERHAGISGQRLGLAHLPDGEFQPPMELNSAEKWVKAGIERAYPGRHVTIGRAAVLTQPIGDRLPCHFCGPCFRGCSTGSYFSSQSSTLPAARKTGKLTLRPHSLAHSVLYDEKNDRATGVRFVDTETGETHEVYARVIFLCASTLGTTRVLLNSKSSRFPDGLGNSSGVVGHYLMDHHFIVGAGGGVPGLLDHYYEGNRPNGFYIPRFRNVAAAGSDRLKFTRGYGYQGGAGRASWGRGAGEAGIGVELKKRLHDPGPWHVSMTGFGECIPRKENRAWLDPQQTDKWGIPLLRIDCSWGPNELAMREDMRTQAAEMLKAAGVTDVESWDGNKPGELGAEPGLGIHEMGTARMGRDPKTSALNANNQLHDAPNVYVTDGACMTSSACQNPSISYMALTARAADHAVREMQRRNA
jgi:glucoside 3-dehydrogenase (cytochrome c) catalytic subunit